MTTEHGVPRPKQIRSWINQLINRQEYLAEKLAGWIENNGTDWDFTNTLTYREICTYEWAIPVLEAEYDSMVRLHKNNQDIERHLEAQERKGEFPRWAKPVKWPLGTETPPRNRRLNFLAAKVVECWGPSYIPLSVRHAAAKAADDIVAEFFKKEPADAEAG